MRVAATLVVLVSACADDAGGACDPSAPTVGDPAAALEMEIVVEEAGATRVVDDGAEVPIIKPPQGGKVIIAGARVRNLSVDRVRFAGWLLDTDSAKVFGLVEQPVFLDVGADGWASPRQPASIQNYANIAACPSAQLPRDVQGQPWRLAIRATDCAGRTAEKIVTITPVCAEPDLVDECVCECDMNYYDPGFSCP